MNKLEHANLLHEQYIKKWDIGNEQFLKRKYAREKAEYMKAKNRVVKFTPSNRPNFSCLHFSGKQYESFDTELERWEEQYKRERELMN